MKFNTYFIYFITIKLLMIYGNPSVPVLLLSNIEFNVQCPAIQQINEDFLRAVLQFFPNLYIFVEEKLSPEDFSSIKQTNLFSHVNNNKINYCPSIVNKLVPDISLKYGDKNKLYVTSNNTGFVEKYIYDSLKSVFPFVHYIYFQDESIYNSRSDMISAHYVLVEKIYDLLKTSSRPFLVLYTALQPSWVYEKKHGLRKKREDEPEPPANQPITINNKTFLTKNTDLMMYLIEPIVLKISPPLASGPSRQELGGCTFTEMSKENFLIKIQCGDRAITFNYTTDATSWIVKSISVENKDFVKAKGKQDLDFYVRDFRASFEYSFHCSEMKLMSEIPKSKRSVILTIRGLQVQLFNGKNVTQEYFSEALDCSGWTSIPILSGLFVSAILLAILWFGIIMMLDIKTNDRFENPKKKRSASFELIS